MHNLPIFLRKPVGSLVLQIEARFSCWQSFCPLFGGSLVSQPEPPCNRRIHHELLGTGAHAVTHTTDARKTRDKLPQQGSSKRLLY